MGSKDPIGRLNDLITEYTEIRSIPDLERYRRINGEKSGHCIFRGCTESISWEDTGGGNFLCEGHFRIMKQWVQEARFALIYGHLEGTR